jgi:hypothetical protein
MPESAPAVRPAIPPVLWAVAVLAYVPVVVLLVLLAVQLQDTRGAVDGRLATAVSQLRDATLPLARAAEPAARQAVEDRPATRRLTAQALPLVRDLRQTGAARQLQLVGALATDLGAHDAGTQLARAGALSTDLLGHRAGENIQRSGALATNLLGADAGRQLQRAGDLSRTLLGADVGKAVSSAERLTTMLGGASLPATASSLRETTDELNRGTRLARLMERLTAVIGQMKVLQFVPKATRAADAVTNEIVPIARRVVALQEETLQVTRDTNRRATNIDRKLGGDLLVPPVP